ncbi:hypothetical protein [uncultured Phascolarctobacterium sp.]|uniref:hypothetical protein n=1 Tax=uncultured Phascolarctobacterium sp. TaxID=512296 RepID=UPI0025E2C057|nr:hypothetical protein [uncultured Phascolarctobacterium sp.]
MYSKLWKIGKMLLVVLVLLTANIGCAPVKGEDKMTNVEWSAFYMNRNHQFRTLCYRFEVNYDPFKEGQATFSCFFVDKKGDNCLLSSAKVTSEDLAELDAFIQKLPLAEQEQKQKQTDMLFAHDATTKEFYITLGSYKNKNRRKVKPQLSSMQQDKALDILKRLYAEVSKREGK